MSLSFEFLVVEKGECWDRVGRVQRIAGIKPEYFHRADALRVPHEIMQELARLFEISNPAFNYYGPTEFDGQALVNLTSALESGWKARCGKQDEGRLADAVRALVACARAASIQGKALLVLGP